MEARLRAIEGTIYKTVLCEAECIVPATIVDINKQFDIRVKATPRNERRKLYEIPVHLIAWAETHKRLADREQQAGRVDEWHKGYAATCMETPLLAVNDVSYFRVLKVWEKTKMKVSCCAISADGLRAWMILHKEMMDNGKGSDLRGTAPKGAHAKALTEALIARGEFRAMDNEA